MQVCFVNFFVKNLKPLEIYHKNLLHEAKDTHIIYHTHTHLIINSHNLGERAQRMHSFVFR